MDEESQLKTDRYSHDTEELCFVSVLERFVRSVEAMEETILFPSVLMDSTVNNLEPDLSPNEVYLKEGMDLRTFCLTMKSLRIQLTQGSSYIQEGVQEDIPTGNKIEELCLQLRPVIRHARYLSYASKEIALSSKPLSFQDYTALEFERALLCEDHSALNLHETLQLFMNAVEEMEQETLFRNLLKSFRASDYGCGLDAEQSLYQLYVSILQGCVPLGCPGSESVIQDVWIVVLQRNRRIHSGSGFSGSLDGPQSGRSWIDLFNKETQNPFSDSFGFKNPIMDFLKETHPYFEIVYNRHRAGPDVPASSI